MLFRAVMGRVLFTWRRFMVASPAPRPSFRTVSLVLHLFFFPRTVDSCAASIELFMPGGEIDSVDKDGNTPLHIAARYGHELLINTLITSGADCTRSVSLPVHNCHAPLVLLLTRKTVVSAKTRSPRHVPSPLGCLECSLGVLQEAPVLR